MREIVLTRGYVATVDDADYPLVAARKWYAKTARTGVTYARAEVKPRQQPRKYEYLHVFLLRPPAGFEVDHRDGNGLNCQRDNLRLCTHAQNTMNRRAWGSSVYLGVSFYARDGRWQAMCSRRWLGRFDCEIEAALAYDVAAAATHGEFARLNFPGHTFARWREILS